MGAGLVYLTVMGLTVVAGPLPAEPPAGNAGLRVIIVESPYSEMAATTRVNRYDVWQHYEVDRQGYFRPRIVYTPDGAYNSVTGEPYPYSMTRPAFFRLRVVR